MREKPIDSKFSIVKDENGKFVLMDITVNRIYSPPLERHDVIKIMNDICNWIDQEYAGEL